MWRGREGRKGRRGLQSEGRNGNDSEQRTPGNGASRLGGQSAGKSRPFGASESPRTATHPFTRFSHEYSIEADRQTSPFRIRSPQYSISEHKYPRFVVAANQGLIRLLSLLSSRPLERKMTEKVRFSSPFSPRICHF